MEASEVSAAYLIIGSFLRFSFGFSIAGMFLSSVTFYEKYFFILELEVRRDDIKMLIEIFKFGFENI